jgi:hypothetical protein
MKIRPLRFNIYLLLILAVFLVSCKTPEERKKGKEASTIRLFLETNRDGAQNGGVAIYRSHPIRLNVDREPFLTEGDLEVASLVDLPGGFGIKAQFNGHGALVMEGVTVAHKSQHIVVQSNFGETRWLAAPLITRRISNGELLFTPDATREEAERIVRGLNNMVAKIKKKTSGF